MDDIPTYILTVLGGAGLWQLVIWVLNRKKTAAETTQIASSAANIDRSTEKLAAETEQVNIANRKNEAEFYRESNEKIIAQMEKLQKAMEADRSGASADKSAAAVEIAGIKATQEAGLRQYEERAGNLLSEMRLLSGKLDAANKTITALENVIKENNVTIAGLKEEVKAGNEKIALLQEVITTLQQKVNDLLERLADSK